MQLHQDYNSFVDRDTIIAVIGPDDAKSFKEYWENNSLPFYGLPDEKHTVLVLYGQQVKLLKLGRMPAEMLIDKKGILRYVHYGNSMEDIPSNKEIIRLLDNLQAEENIQK